MPPPLSVIQQTASLFSGQRANHRTAGPSCPPAVTTFTEENIPIPHSPQAQQRHRYRQDGHDRCTHTACQPQAAASTTAWPVASEDLDHDRQNDNEFHHHHRHHDPRTIDRVHAQHGPSYDDPQSLATAAHTNQGHTSSSGNHNYDGHPRLPTMVAHHTPIPPFRRDDLRNPEYSSQGARYLPSNDEVEHFERRRADPNVSVGRYPPPVNGYDDARILDQQQRQFLQQQRRRPERNGGGDDSWRLFVEGHDRYHHHHHHNLESLTPHVAK